MSIVLTTLLALNLTSTPALDLTPVRVSDADIRGAVRALNQDDWRDALRFSEAALQDGPRKSVRIAAHANACIAQYHLGDVTAAIAACEAALELAPDHETVQANLTAIRAQAQ